MNVYFEKIQVSCDKINYNHKVLELFRQVKGRIPPSKSILSYFESELLKYEGGCPYFFLNAAEK